MPVTATGTDTTLSSSENGASTSFWDDVSLPEGPLSEILPAIQSHATRPMISVKMALQDGIDGFLQPRLTRAGAADRAKLSRLQERIELTTGDDVRVCPLQDTRGQLQTSKLYRTMAAAASPGECPFAQFI